MAEFTIDLSDFLKNVAWTENQINTAAERGVNDSVDELVRISSAIANFDKGFLEKSWERSVKREGDSFVGEVTYSVKEKDGKGNVMDYAKWIHEDPNYKYGPGTLAKPGTEGWSGQHYEPGRKYLERPLLGEANAFWDHIAAEIKKEVGS